MKRRDFLALGVALPVLSKAGKVTTRSAEVEKLFDTPGPQPNGLQATSEGLWILDQAENRVYLVGYQDGRVLRTLETGADRGSGITFDGQSIWIASTYDRKIIRADAMSGKTLAEYFTPGAGVIYQMISDPVNRRSPLAKLPSTPQRQQSLPNRDPRPGTGAHGLEWRDSKLWVAVPPSRTVYRIDPSTWVVEHKFSTVGNRPHGIGWQGKWLWCTDSNLNAFCKHDPSSGEVVEKIQLSDRDPLPHGMTIHQAAMWYCDDVGIVCRLRL